jgi:Flp pilus assembly protein TadG
MEQSKDQLPKRFIAARKEKGQSMVELAVSFMFLMLLLAGAVDFSRAFFALIALYDSAQEATVFGSTDPTNYTGMELHARHTSSDPIDLTDTTDVAVVITPIGAACAGNGIRVDVTYQFNFTMPFINLIVPSNTVPLTGTSTSTILTPGC